MAREFTGEFERVVRERIASLRAERETLIGKRRGLDEEITSLDAEIKQLEAVLHPNAGDVSVRTPSATSTTTADLVCDLLTETGTPLHYRAIYERLLTREPRPPRSTDPATALLARYYNDPRLRRTAPGTYALRKPTRIASGRMMRESQWTHKRPVAYTLLGTRHEVRTFKDILLGMCATLYDLDPATFRQVLNAESTRNYFSEDKRDLRNPAEIADSGIFAAIELRAAYLEARCQGIMDLFELDDGDFAIETVER